jgi:acyl carrier protein
MPSESPTFAKVLAVLRRHAADGAVVEMDSPLFADGIGLDSVGFLDVVIGIEEAVGIRLGEEDLTEQVLVSVGALIAHIERLRAAGPT